jgi:hypothetical protein
MWWFVSTSPPIAGHFVVFSFSHREQEIPYRFVDNIKQTNRLTDDLNSNSLCNAMKLISSGKTVLAELYR